MAFFYFQRKGQFPHSLENMECLESVGFLITRENKEVVHVDH